MCACVHARMRCLLHSYAGCRLPAYQFFFFFFFHFATVRTIYSLYELNNLDAAAELGRNPVSKHQI